MTKPHSPRQAILLCIQEHPGCHLRALERLLPYSLGALRHHLKQLEEVGLIRVEYDLRFKRFYPREMGADLRETCAVLRSRSMRRVLVLLLSTPGLTSTAVASRLGMPRSSLGHYMRRLRQKGIIVRDSALDATWTLSNPQAVEAALLTFKSSFIDRVIDGALEVFDAAGPPDPPAPAPDPAARAPDPPASAADPVPRAPDPAEE